MNFDGDPKAAFDGKVIAVRGEVWKLGGKPVVSVRGAGAVDQYDL